MSRLVPAALLVAALFSFAAPARAAAPDWEALKDVSQIEIFTHDEDGSERQTTIWFATVDGEGFIRTGDSTWGENIRRNPADVVLKIEDNTYPMQAEFIENDSLRERVIAAFREKYGWSDGFVQLFRGKRPNIMHVMPR